jgi:hypothetical protein
MRKLWMAFAIAMVALMMVASPALAWGGGGSDASANVDCGDIDVTDDSPMVGTTITFSGTVDITATAHVCGFVSSTGAQSEAWYFITDPEGTVIYSGHQVLSDFDLGLLGASSDASQIYVWSQDVPITMIGDYTAEHGGSAEACYFSLIPLRYDSAIDERSSQRTVTSHGGAGLGMVASPARLVIQLPAGLAVEKPLHSKSFFSSDGWGDPTSDVIVYSDGTWQVEIPDGTIVQLDGEWHKYTWIEVDNQGNVIGKYGSDGHTIAEEIGLSQPITVTKVG